MKSLDVEMLKIHHFHNKDEISHLGFDKFYAKSIGISSRILRELDWTLHEDFPNIHNFIAEFDGRPIGVLTAQKFDNKIGWLNAGTILREYRQMGVFNKLREVAESWLVQNDVQYIRTSITSDNLSIRSMFERKLYSPYLFAIEPNMYLDQETPVNGERDDFAAIVNQNSYEKINKSLQQNLLSGNIMIDNIYVPFTKELMEELISQRRIYSDLHEETFIILSHRLLKVDGTLQGFVVSNSISGYYLGAKALAGFAAENQASEVICHAPSRREAVRGTTSAGFAWNYPYSLVVYQREITKNAI